MKVKDKIELTRNILNKATNMHISKELLIKISQKLDDYIVMYYKETEEQNIDNG